MKARDNSTVTTTTGMALALGAAVVSGVAVFVNAYGVRAVPDATVYTTAKNLVAAVVLVAVAALAVRPGTAKADAQPRRLRAGQVVGLATVAVIGGAVAFVLFFEGLAHASSGQAAFVHKTLIIWVAVLAVPILGERLRPLHVVAIATLVVGQAVLLGGLGNFRFGRGEWLVLAATLLWSVETVLAKWLLREVPARKVALARMGLGAALLTAWVVVTGRWSALSGLGGEGWAWAALTGVILAGYVALWYSALALAPAVDVTAVLVVAAVITGMLNVIVKGATVTAWTGSGLVIVGVGGVLAVVAARLRPPVRTAA